MDYEFLYDPHREVNQGVLDEDMMALLGDVYRGSAVWRSEQNPTLAVRVVLTVSRDLTEGELNAISGA